MRLNFVFSIINLTKQGLSSDSFELNKVKISLDVLKSSDSSIKSLTNKKTHFFKSYSVAVFIIFNECFPLSVMLNPSLEPWDDIIDSILPLTSRIYTY